MPIASGASGPTTVKSIFCLVAKSIRSWVSEILIFSILLSRSVPPLPGATYIFFTAGL